MDRAKAKRIALIALIGALLVAGALRSWEWLEPWRVFGVGGLKVYVQR